eukprot:SAG11_NODE_19864_length_457_cov_1.120112_1_plen_61_part_10
MLATLLLSVPAATLSSSSSLRSSPVVLRNPRAAAVSYDARSLMINGERKLWVSGGMHFSRH